MDILIRIIIMIICGIAIPFISNMIYEPFRDIEEIKKLNIIEKIMWGGFYVFLANWFVVAPAIIFFECFKYFIN